MRIAVVDLLGKARSSLSPTFESAVLAVQRQVHEHFAPVWGMDAHIHVVSLPSLSGTSAAHRVALAQLRSMDGLIYVSLGNKTEQRGGIPGAVGYHFKSHR